MSCLGVPRKAVRPATKLAILLPEAKRRVLWKQMEIDTLLEFPKLRHPRWARDVIRTLAVAATVAAQYYGRRLLHPRGEYWISFEFGVIAVFVMVRQGLYAATASLGTGLPFKTVGELAQALLKTNFSHFSPHAGNTLPYSTKDVWEQMLNVLSEESGVDPSSISPETRFREDLKMA